MSIRLMTEVWGCDLSHPQQSVLLAMADHANDDGEDVFPSVALVAWKTGYSSRQVQRIIQQLVAMKVLRLVAGSIRHEANEYVIAIAYAERKKPFKTRQNVTPKIVRGDITGARRGDISSVPYKEESSVLEPSREYRRTLYKFYPRKKAPRRADKAIKAAFHRLMTEKELDGKNLTIEEAYEFLFGKVRAHADYHRQKQTKEEYIPHPASWFNDGGYLEGVATVSRLPFEDEPRTVPMRNPADVRREQLRRDR